MRRLVILAVLFLAASPAIADDCRYGFTTGDQFGFSGIDAAVFGDFNEDGVVDAVFSDALYLNRRYGQFDRSQIDLGGFAPFAATDVNGDGHLDLVLTGLSSGIAVKFGDGKGNFGPVISSGTHDTVERLVDLNGDGVKDAVYKSSPTYSLTVQFGTRDGHFGSPQPVIASFVSFAPYRIGDFDGDGHPDLFWSNQVWWGDGHGNFVASLLQIADSSDVSVLDPWDFDRDGAADLLFATAAGDLKLVRLKGRTVTTTPVTSNDPLPSGRLTATADLDGDGYTDGVFDTGMVVWGSSDPTRLETMHFDLKYSPRVSLRGAAVLDFEGNGSLDIVSMGGAAGLTILHTKPGSRQLFAGDIIGTPFADVVTVGDVNGDGRPDRIVIDSHGKGAVYLGDRNGHFTFHNSFDLGVSGSIAVADFDGDGKADLLVVGSHFGVFFGDGQGSFGSPVVIPEADTSVEWPYQIVRGGKGAKSLIMITTPDTLATVAIASDRTETVKQVSGTQFLLRRMTVIDGVPAMFVDIDTTHEELREYVNGDWKSITTLSATSLPIALDIDGDGRTEIVYPWIDGVYLTRLTDQGLSPAQAISGFPTEAFNNPFQIADIDGDGKADLIFFRQTDEYAWQVQAAHNLGLGNGFEYTAAATTTYATMTTADVNGDGRDDVILIGPNGTEILTSTCLPVPPIVPQLIPAVPLAGDDVTLSIAGGWIFGLYADGSKFYVSGTTQSDGSTLYRLGRLSAGAHIFRYIEPMSRFGTRQATITVTVFDSVPKRHAVHH